MLLRQLTLSLPEMELLRAFRQLPLEERSTLLAYLKIAAR
jgi:hypothetical protein